MTPEDLAEGKRRLAAWRSPEGMGFADVRLDSWLREHADALLAAEERAQRAEVQLAFERRVAATAERERDEADELSKSLRMLVEALRAKSDYATALLRKMLPVNPFDCGFCLYCESREYDDDSQPGKHNDGCDYDRARSYLENVK